MRPISFLSVLFATSLLAACASSPTIRSDYDHNIDFNKYRTFGFMNPLATDRAGYSTLLTERLKTATRNQMELRGYTYAANHPDLLVNFNGKLTERTQVTPAPMMPYYGYRWGFYGGWPGYGMGADVYQYTEGTINVDLVDAARRQLVWEGVGQGELNEPSQLSSASNVEKTIALIFDKYPFRAGSGAPQSPVPGTK
jgi:hypothetical protein